MGRFFQYNRLGAKDNANSSKKDNNTNDKMENHTSAIRNPAYSAVYAKYMEANPTEIPATGTSSSTAKTAARNVSDFAIKKCQQWSNRLLITTNNAAAATATSDSTTSTTSTATSRTTTSVTSGYHSRHSQQDHLNEENATHQTHSRTHRMYDCMKDFLRRKIFQHNSSELKHVTLMSDDDDDEVHTGIDDDDVDDDEDATSDYDEHDMLDSSYNADEDDEDALNATGCSCSYASGTDSEPIEYVAVVTKKSPQKSLLSLNCWQSSNRSDTSSNSSGNSSDSDDEDAISNLTEDSDAGISDCQHLLVPPIDGVAENRRTKCTRSRKRRHGVRYNTDNDAEIEQELLANSWFQPRISSKATLAHLQHANPGSFLVRRHTAARLSYELCVRAEHKVKNYTILHTSQDTYKLKGAKKQFSTLKALITHHSVMAEQLPLTLDLPREKNFGKHEIMRYTDDFEQVETLQLLGILKSLQAKHIEF